MGHIVSAAWGLAQATVTTDGQILDAWYPGGAISTLELREQPGGTLMVNTLRYESAEALQAVLASPMEEGVTSSYDHLEKLLLERVAGGAA